MICAMNEVFNGVSCVKIATVEEGKDLEKNYLHFRNQILSFKKLQIELSFIESSPKLIYK